MLLNRAMKLLNLTTGKALSQAMGITTTSGVACALTCLVYASLLLPRHAAGQESYVRIDGGWNKTSHVRFSDNHCGNTTPPALFGCGAGNDGSPLGAVGDFGESGVLGIGLGHRFSPLWRADVVVERQTVLAFNGRANFRNTPGDQPVTGDVSVTTALLNTYLDIAPLLGESFGNFQPYVGLGIGFARKHAGAMHYRFPGLSPQALTATPGGTRTDPAWRATIGTGIALSRTLAVDLAWHYTDLGQVKTDTGAATIVRASTRMLSIDSTHAPLRTQGFSIGLRYHF